jgi:hypothetical protein
MAIERDGLRRLALMLGLEKKRFGEGLSLPGG